MALVNPAEMDTALRGSGMQPMEPALTAPADTAMAAWNAILDVLELAVGAAERTLKDPLGPLSAAPQAGAEPQPEKRWQPPSLPGPLPAGARRRALALAAAQERVARRLEAARLDISRQLQAVSSVPGVGNPAGAVYLDVNG